MAGVRRAVDSVNIQLDTRFYYIEIQCCIFTCIMYISTFGRVAIDQIIILLLFSAASELETCAGQTGQWRKRHHSPSDLTSETIPTLKRI